MTAPSRAISTRLGRIDLRPTSHDPGSLRGTILTTQARRPQPLNILNSISSVLLSEED